MLTAWRIRRLVDHSGRERFETKSLEAYIFESDGAYKLNGWSKNYHPSLGTFMTVSADWRQPNDWSETFGQCKEIFGLTFTYDDTHLPSSRKEANGRIQAFWKRLRAARNVLKQELRYIYVTEHKHGEGRWHHHVLINATGDDYKVIRDLWGQGNIEFKQLRVDRDKNYETLARYLCKEQRDKVGQRLWSGSRSLRKPEKDCFRVPNDTPLTPPPKAAVLFDNGDIRTEYGHYRYIKYLAGGWPTAGTVRAKRRRRKSRT